MRCPHCGEPVQRGQETCFACGEKLKVRRFRRGQIFDLRILILVAALAVVGLSGLLVFHLRGRKTELKTGQKKRSPKVQKGQVVTASTDDTVRQPADRADIERAREQLDRLEKRYATVKSQVVGENPTPEQRELMAQIDRKLSIFQRRVGEYAGAIKSQQKQSLQKELNAQQREINNLISRFSRAPKNR
ncbi:MAG: zinc ribbon domain-containing protein [bacterium]